MHNQVEPTPSKQSEHTPPSAPPWASACCASGCSGRRRRARFLFVRDALFAAFFARLVFTFDRKVVFHSRVSTVSIASQGLRASTFPFNALASTFPFNALATPACPLRTCPLLRPLLLSAPFSSRMSYGQLWAYSALTGAALLLLSPWEYRDHDGHHDVNSNLMSLQVLPQ